jgi:signal transduction histidine kinase
MPELQSFTVLYVDDEPQSLKYFTKAFQDDFRVLTARSVEEARVLIENDTGELAVVITDQRMPSASGVDLLGWVRVARPHAVRILTTAFSDLEGAIEAVNVGAIFRYVTKPWNLRDLRGILLRAIDVHRLQHDHDVLLHEKRQVLQRLMLIDQVRSHLTRLNAPADQVARSLDAIQARCGGDDRAVDAAVASARSAIARIQGAVNDLRTFSDPVQSSTHEVFAINDALSLVMRQKDMVQIAGWISSTPDATYQVTAAKHQIIQLFNHLLANSAAAMRLVADGRKPEIAISARQEGERLHVSVKDNGIGVPIMNLPRVYDAFFTTKQPEDGMGLGLTIARSIVADHGGSMYMRSEYGRYCEVTFDLPLVAAAQ